MNLDDIRTKLLTPNFYAIIPAEHKNTILPLAEWEIEKLEDNTVVKTGEYYSPQTLSAALGNLLVLVEYIDERFFLMRYGFDIDTFPQVKAYLESIGLVDMRVDANGERLNANEIDYSSLTGNEFAIVPTYMIEDMPKRFTPPADEEIE